MQFERRMKIVKQYHVHILNMIVERVLKDVYQIKVVRVVLQVLGQDCLKERRN